MEIVSLHTQVEEAEASLQEIANQLQLLEEHVAAETESKEQAVQHALELEKSRDELSEIHQQSLQVMEELRSQLRSSQESEVDLKSQLESQKLALNSALEELKSEMERELQELTCQLESESNLRRTLEQERNMAKEELQSMHGLVENETASYRFQLSSQSKELQQAKEVIIASFPGLPHFQFLIACNTQNRERRPGEFFTCSTVHVVAPILEQQHIQRRGKSYP